MIGDLGRSAELTAANPSPRQGGGFLPPQPAVAIAAARPEGGHVDYDRPISRPELRRISKTFGALYLITFITSIPALWLYQPVLDNPVHYIAGAGHDNRIFFGAFLELLLIISNIGTAIVVYPLLKRVNEICAIGYVTARVMECTFILVGILSVIAVVGLRDSPPAGSQAVVGSIAYTLAAIKDWTFLLGPGFVVGIGNGLLLGYLMYRSGLVPRRMAMLGLVAGPLICITGVLAMFGAIEVQGTVQSLATIPEFVWELFLGLYPLIKGFKTDAPVLTGEIREDALPRQGTPAVAAS
jgi:hypothetical protein